MVIGERSARLARRSPGSCRRGDLREPRRAPGSSFSLQSTTEDALMPTLTTREHGEIHVHYHHVTRMADRLCTWVNQARRAAEQLIIPPDRSRAPRAEYWAPPPEPLPSVRRIPLAPAD